MVSTILSRFMATFFLEQALLVIKIMLFGLSGLVHRQFRDVGVKGVQKRATGTGLLYFIFAGCFLISWGIIK